MGLLAEVGEALVIAVHFVMLGLLVVGGYVALRYRWVLPVHLGMVAWGVLSVVFVWDCPLTALQQWLRALAGRPPLPGGFIDTYISGVIVPADADGPVQIIVLAVVLASWVLLIRQAVRLRRARGGVVEPSVENPTDDAPVTVGPPTRG